MLLPVLSLLFQTPGTLPGGQPVRTWLEPAGLVAPGQRMSVFVTTARDGHILALRVTTDRHIEVVFPADPRAGTFVEAGSYELRGAQDAAAFVAAEPPGGGVVVAALSAAPFDFTEFAAGGEWDRAALTAVLTHGDPVGALLDVTQRMLGPEYFNYDVVTYTVAPRASATQVVVMTSPVPYPACYGWGWGWEWGCGFVPRRVLPRPCLFRLGDCDPGAVACRGGRVRLAHHFGCEPRCRLGAGCTEERVPTAVALYRESRPIGRARPVTTSEPPRPRDRPRPIEPRNREPTARPVAGAPRRPAPISGGTRAKPLLPGDPRARTKARVTEALAPGRALPERVPWPAADPRPRAAPPKPTGASPPMPERIGWPTAAVDARRTTRAPAAAVPIPRTRGAAVWPAGPPASSRAATGGPVAAGGRSGAVAPARALPPRAGARTGKAAARAKP